MNLFGKKKDETKAAPACACNKNAVEMKAGSMATGCGSVAKEKFFLWSCC